MLLFSLMISVLTLAGCAAQQVAGPSPEYAPVVPQPRIASSVPTGSIFSPSNADSWFGEKKTYQVGDVITGSPDLSHGLIGDPHGVIETRAHKL